jgi:hypothetical protein
MIDVLPEEAKLRDLPRELQSDLRGVECLKKY